MPRRDEVAKELHRQEMRRRRVQQDFPHRQYDKDRKGRMSNGRNALLTYSEDRAATAEMLARRKTLDVQASESP